MTKAFDLGQHITRSTVLVMDYVTQADQVALVAGDQPDLTYAYNLATRATEEWVWDMGGIIQAPRYPHKVYGTVYVRKGQELDGCGTHIDAGSGSYDVRRFVLGSGLIGGVQTMDPGGERVSITNFRSVGGSPNHGFVWTDAPGFAISNLFLTSCGMGLEIVEPAGDGNIDNIEIDQCLTGILLDSAQNLLFSNINMFSPNYAITFRGSCRDISFNGGAVLYTQYSSVYFEEGSVNHRAIIFSGFAFTLNVQYPTFEGFVVSRASQNEVQFVGCSFRNMRSWAVTSHLGTGSRFTFVGCVFDSRPATDGYNASTTAAGISNATGSVWTLQGCEFRNLFGPVLNIVQDVSSFIMSGGIVYGGSEDRIASAAGVGYSPDIRFHDVEGIAFIKNTPTHQAIVLPYWGNSTAWEIGFNASSESSYNGLYHLWRKLIASACYAFDGTSAQTWFDKVGELAPPARVIPDMAALPISVCGGNAPGGPAFEPAFSSVGKMCISIPIAAANAGNVYWTASTLR